MLHIISHAFTGHAFDCKCIVNNFLIVRFRDGEIKTYSQMELISFLKIASKLADSILPMNRNVSRGSIIIKHMTKDVTHPRGGWLLFFYQYGYIRTYNMSKPKWQIVNGRWTPVEGKVNLYAAYLRCCTTEQTTSNMSKSKLKFDETGTNDGSYLFRTIFFPDRNTAQQTNFFRLG